MSEPKFFKGEWGAVPCINGGGLLRRGHLVGTNFHPQPSLQIVPLADAYLCGAAQRLYRELAHLVRLLAPLEEAGILEVAGLATLNGARAALALARGEGA